jgi:hypothetical protein
MIGLILTVAAMQAAEAPSRWLTVQNDEAGLTEIDVDTMRRSGNRAIIWVRHTYAREQRDGTRTLIYQEEFDCVNRTSTALAWVARASGGRVLNSGTFTERNTSPVAPESTGEELLGLACAE